jgi:type IV pilus assembly protein PilP
MIGRGGSTHSGRRVSGLGPLVWVILVTPGCGEDEMADLRQYVAEVKANQRIAVEPLPEIRTIEPFRFDPTGLKDPFAILEAAPGADTNLVDHGVRPDLSRPREPLENFELDSLRMVGLVAIHGEVWGLIHAADDDTVYRVRVGDHLGRNFGRIVRINEDGLELVEIIADGLGGWQERKAALRLSQGANEQK